MKKADRMKIKGHDPVGALWKAFFLFHDNYKYYYIKLAILLSILLTPLNAILNPYNWMIPADEWRMLSIIFLIIFSIFAVFAFILYLTVWRVLFPTYWIVEDKTEPLRAGRLYWSSEGWLASLGYRIRDKHNLEMPNREYMTFLINQGRILNPMNPWASFDVIHLPRETKFYRGPTAIYVWEPSTRRKLLANNGKIDYVCENEGLTINNTDSREVVEKVAQSVNEMVRTAQTASHADVGLTKELLKDSAVYIPPDVKAFVDGLEAPE